MTISADLSRLFQEIQSNCPSLPDKPHETPEATMERLMAAAESRGQLVEHLVQERIKGVPLAYLTGREQFMGLVLETDPGAMIPRKETEILCTAALHHLRQLAESAPQVTLFDLCTGSGNLALALAHHEPKCTAWGGDLCPGAVSLARRNSERLGLAHRVSFLEGDFLTPFREHPRFGQADMLLCNPPYISSAKVDGMAQEIINFEPREAFDGGPMGISFLLRLTREAHEAVRPGGWVGCEVGAGQGESLYRVFTKTGHYDLINSFTEDEGRIRAILARKASVHTGSGA